MTLPLSAAELAELEETYPLRGVWRAISADHRKQIATRLDSALQTLDWKDSPFTDQTAYTETLGIYTYLLGRVADQTGDIGFFFDEEDDSYIMYDHYLNSPRPKTTDKSSSGGSGTNPANTGRIAPIEYV